MEKDVRNMEKRLKESEMTANSREHEANLRDTMHEELRAAMWRLRRGEKGLTVSYNEDGMRDRKKRERGR